MQAGDRKAFDRFFTAHAPRVLLYIHYHLGGRLRRKVDPADILQELYAKVFTRFAPFRRRAEAMGVRKLLIRMADHEITEAYRYHFKVSKRDARRELSAALAERDDARERVPLDWVPSDATSITARVARHEEYQQAIRMLRILSPLEQYVTVARVIEGLSMAEIAAKLGKSSGALRMILSRARDKLRRRASKQGI
jgi:RNA polymerase sigma-70 factor (ECF subfamily)